MGIFPDYVQWPGKDWLKFALARPAPSIKSNTPRKKQEIGRLHKKNQHDQECQLSSGYNLFRHEHDRQRYGIAFDGMPRSRSISILSRI